MKKCVICGKEFESKREIQVQCGSEECRREYLRRKAREHYTDKKVVLKQKTCAECGKIFMPKNMHQVTCSEKCRKERGRRAAREWAAEHKQERKPKEPKTYRKVCEVCGKEYICKNPRQKYCSDECAKAALHKQVVFRSARSREMERERKRMGKRAKRVQTSHEALADAAVEARAAGMSYGQWQARRYANVGRAYSSNR